MLNTSFELAVLPKPPRNYVSVTENLQQYKVLDGVKSEHQGRIIGKHLKLASLSDADV